MEIPRWHAFLTHMHWILQIHLLCDKYRYFDGNMAAEPFLSTYFHIYFQALVGLELGIEWTQKSLINFTNTFRLPLASGLDFDNIINMMMKMMGWK